MNNQFIEKNNVIINSDIFETKFTCNLQKCKGACCTMESEFGAPLEKDEIEIIERNLPGIKNFMPEYSIKEIEKNGFWENKYSSLMTRSINNKDCVFVFFENSIAKCAIENAYNNGKSDFLKPISCHLFPIRVNNLGGPILKFEEYSECKPALENGIKTNLTTFEFCKDALQRHYGKKWYQEIIEYLRS